MSWNRFAWQWLLMALLGLLVCVLGVLQYRWIAQISDAERGAMRESLRSSLAGASRDFDAALNAALSTFVPTADEVRKVGRETAYQRRYAQWLASGGQAGLFKRVALAWPEQGQAKLLLLSGSGGTAQWPDSWLELRRWVQSRGFSAPGGQPERRANFDAYTIDLPRFDNQADSPGEQDWLLAEVDPKFAGGVLLPQLLARSLGADFLTQYRFDLLLKDRPAEILFSSDRDLPGIVDPRKPRLSSPWDPRGRRSGNLVRFFIVAVTEPSCRVGRPVGSLPSNCAPDLWTPLLSARAAAISPSRELCCCCCSAHLFRSCASPTRPSA